MIFTGTIVWPKGIFKAEKFDENAAQAKFGCSLLIPKDDPQIEAIKNTIYGLIDSELGGEAPDDRYMPFKDGDKNSNPDFAGHWELRFKSNEDSVPGVVDGNCDPIIDPGAIVGGDSVRIDGNIYAYSRKFKGIGMQLNNVQWISNGEKVIGGSKKRAEDAFTKIPNSSSPSQKTINAPKQSVGGFLD